jgi:hypothetical protein
MTEIPRRERTIKTPKTFTERAGIVQQVKSLTRQNGRGLSKEKGFELER